MKYIALCATCKKELFTSDNHTNPRWVWEALKRHKKETGHVLYTREHIATS